MRAICWTLAVSAIGAAAFAQPLVVETTLAGGIEARGLMFDLVASGAGPLWIPKIDLNVGPLPAPSRMNCQIWVRDGTFVGHTMSADGWQPLGDGIHFESSGGSGGWTTFESCRRSLIVIPTGTTVGVFIVTAEPQHATPIPPALPEYGSLSLTLRGGVAKPDGRFSGPDIPDVMINARVQYRSGEYCPANCDFSTTPPIVNVADFSCFLGTMAAGSIYANCDCSTRSPVLNVADFLCYLNLYAAGCSGP